jgi:Glycosyl transferase family 90
VVARHTFEFPASLQVCHTACCKGMFFAAAARSTRAARAGLIMALGTRYPVYIESCAWSTNFKHKLAAGSVTLAIQPHYYEFFSRALVPGMHYIPIDESDICNDIVRKVCASDFSCTFGQQRQCCRIASRH